MSFRDEIRELGPLVTDETGGVARPVRIERADVTWSPQAGTPTRDQSGVFTTEAVISGTDAAMLGVVTEGVTLTAVIATDAAATGSYFQPGKGTRVVLTEGPDLHDNGGTPAEMVFVVRGVRSIALGGALRLELGGPHGVSRALGGGTPGDA